MDSYFIIRVIEVFTNVLQGALFIRVILSWIIGPFASPNTPPFLFKLNAFIVPFTDPLIQPARRLLSRFNTGPIDLSLIVTFFAISILSRLLVRLVILFLG